MADIDRRGTEHQSEMENYLRERVKALEAQVKFLKERCTKYEEQLEEIAEPTVKDTLKFSVPAAKGLRGGWGNG